MLGRLSLAKPQAVSSPHLRRPIPSVQSPSSPNQEGFSMRFTDEQVKFFRENGYLAVPGFFTPTEAKAMQAEIERFKREGLVRNVATEGDGKTTSAQKKNLQICPMYMHSPIFKAL